MRELIEALSSVEIVEAKRIRLKKGPGKGMAPKTPTRVAKTKYGQYVWDGYSLRFISKTPDGFSGYKPGYGGWPSEIPVEDWVNYHHALMKKGGKKSLPATGTPGGSMNEYMLGMAGLEPASGRTTLSDIQGGLRDAGLMGKV